MAYRTGLLLLTQPSGFILPSAKDLLASAANKVSRVLYVQWLPSLAQLGGPLRQGRLGGDLRVAGPDRGACLRLYRRLYSCAWSVCPGLDLRLVQSLAGPPESKTAWPKFSHTPEILLYDKPCDDEAALVAAVSRQYSISTPLQAALLPPPSSAGSSHTPSEVDEEVPSYREVACGGTMDGLHVGHRLLLAEVVALTSDTLHCGITTPSLTANKTLRELIPSVGARQEAVRGFLADVAPHLTCHVFPLHDPYGPTVTRPHIQAVVVSPETLKGATAINDKRAQQGMPALAVRVIELLEDGARGEEEEEKVSSSSLRRRRLGTLLKPPTLEGKSRGIYVIGVTGGVASGKTSVCRRLEKTGAVVIDCDKLGHAAYEAGSQCHAAVVEAFGRDILSPTGAIDRKKLGPKVFGDKEAMTRLTSLVWPEIRRLAGHKLAEAEGRGATLAVLEAAVLLEASWMDMTHEVWVLTVPRPEAVKRVVERDGRTEEAAGKMIDSQMSNEDRVAHANVVLSTLWHPDVTQKQVDKAWSLLSERLPDVIKRRLDATSTDQVADPSPVLKRFKPSKI